MEKSKWYDTYFKKLEQFGISPESINKLKEDYGTQIASASYATKADSDYAYEGSLLDVALTKVAAYAVKINGLYPEAIRVDTNSLLKVCLLQSLSMCLRIKPNENQWRVEHLGEVYEYNNNNPAIGVGLHSIAIATECGISFTAEEMEAMTIIDRSDDDLQAKFYSSMLTNIVKQAVEMTMAEGKAIHKNNLNNE